jgi:ParB family transcriptional regulator, chromosome partitioning protein
MATAVKETAAPAGEYRLVPIKAIDVVDGFNNRRSLGDISELAASIQSVGLLEPLLVWEPNGNGRLHLIAGQRRLKACQEAGLKTVPVIVRQLDDVARLEALLIENLHRKDIDPIEEADGYNRLLELGVKQKDIASKVGRSEAHVSKRLALSGLSPLAAKHLAAGTIPIDAAVKLAKYAHEHQDRAIKDVEGNYRGLENSAPYQLRNLGDRARDEAKKDARRQKRAELVRKLKADGVAILSAQQSYHWGEPGHPWELGKAAKDHYGRERGRVNLTPKQHSEFPCHAAAVTSPGSIYDTTEPKVVYLCSDPTSHMDVEEKAKYKKKIADSKRDPYEERQRAEKAVRAELAEARAARLPAIREQLKAFDRPTLLKLALEAIVMDGDATATAGILGLEVSKGKNPWEVVAPYCNASEANLVRAAAAVAIHSGQEAIGGFAHAQAGNFYFNRDELPQAVALAQWFKQVGIELTEVETKALEKAAKK